MMRLLLMMLILLRTELMMWHRWIRKQPAANSARPRMLPGCC